MKHYFTYILICLLVPFTSMAQEQKKIDFFGSGRFSMFNSKLGGELIKTDSVTPQRQLTGSTLFDLGFHIRPGAETEIKAITRVSNDLNGFWGAGINFYLRELYLRGTVLGKIKYQVGDLNTKLTPYTLYNYEAELGAYNPNSLNTFGTIIDYDKFYGDHSWRQQGATIDFGFNFDKYLDKVWVKGLITKNRQTDFFSTPDRLFSSGVLGMQLFKQLSLTYTLASSFDVAKTAMFSNQKFSNTIHSIGLIEEKETNKYKLYLSGEAGTSIVSYENIPDAPSKVEGTFGDIEIGLRTKKEGLKVSLGANVVETGFRSMGAQSRRVDYNATASQFPYYTNQEIIKPAAMMDLLTDGNFFQMFLRPELADYNPAYENIRPYGKATPNRTGTEGEIQWQSRSKVKWNAGFRGVYAQEITGQGTTNLRKFTELNLNLGIKLNTLFNMKKPLTLSAYYRGQQTNREGTLGIDKIDFGSTQLKTGIEFEVIPKLEIQTAALWLTANGNEYLADRNSYNEIVFYNAYNADLKELLWLGGINYQFSKHNCLKIQWQQSQWNNGLLPANNYQINRFVVLYNLFF